MRGIPADRDMWLDWLFTNIDKTKGRGAGLGQIARDQFTGMLDECVVRLLQVAQREQDTTAVQWAGRTLARLYISLQKHHGTLSNINSAYRATAKKTRKDPTGRVAS